MANYGSVNAAEHRALTNRPMSDADEIRLMKLEIQRARRAAAAQPAAAKQTASVASGAKTALKTYQGKAQTHYNQWHSKHGGNYSNRTTEMADWQTAWNDSPEGKAAKKELEPHLLNYSKAAQDEMRLAAEANPGDPGAVNKKRDEINGRDTDGSWAETVMNGIVTNLAVPIAAESPEPRRAIVATDGALAERNDAAGELNTLLTDKANALKGVRQGWMRQEISEGYDAQIKAARDRLARAELALKSVIEHELSLDLTGDVLEGANKSLADVRTLPPRLRKAELPDAQAWVGNAQSQYDAAVGGVFDPEYYTSEQVDAAVKRVLGRHPGLIDNPFALTHLLLTGEALKTKPALDLTLATLDPSDPRLPEWLKTLAGDEKTKVNAAFIIMLAQSTVPTTEAEMEAAKKDPLWALSRYRPTNTAETALAAKDPMTFAMLKYLGGSLDENQFGDFNDIAQRNEARKLVEDLATAALATPSGTQKMVTLQILTMAIKDVRADYVESMVTKILGGQKASDGVDQIQSRKILNPDAGPAAIERASALVKANLEGSFSQDEQLQVWSQVEGPMRTYINDQWTHIAGLPDSSRDAVASSYVQAMSAVAPAPVASLVLDGLMANLDPAVQFPMDMPEFAKSIRALVERAPYRAPDVAKWVVNGGGDPDKGIVPQASLMTPDSDGNGIALGQAMLNEIAAKHGTDSNIYKNLKQAYERGLPEAQKGLGAQARLEQLQLFNADRNNIVQTMFDNLLKKSGALFTQSHSLAGLNPVERQNLIGKGLMIPIDHPSAQPGDALYSDPDKLKRINWIIDHAVEIGGDNPTVTFTPAIYASKDSGSVTVVMLLRVEGDKNGDGVITRKAVPEQIGTKPLDDEDMIIDATVVDPEIGAPALKDENVPWQYTDFQSFREDNQLSDDGLLFMTNNTNDLLLHRRNDGHADVNLDGIDAAIFTGWEKFRRGADITLGIAALVAGGLLIAGSGGLATPLVATGAAVWFGIRTLETAGEMTEHGQSLNPFNSKSDNAWLGCIDPAAGTLWLGGIASVSGLAAMKPLLLLRTTGLLGRAITPAEQLALSAMNVSGTEFRTAWQADLLLNTGLRTNLYQQALRSVPETIGGNIVKWGVNGTAITSGGALMTAQGASFIEALKNGQIDFSDWSLNSATWDFMLFGLGALSFGAGLTASLRPWQFATDRPPSDIALPDHLTRPVFWAHEKPDGTFVFMRVGPDGTMIPDVDAPWANGSRPEFVTLFETYLGADGARAPRRRLDFIGMGEGHYRVIVTEADGRVWTMNDQTGSPWSGQEPGTTYAHQNADGSFRVSTMGDPIDPTFRVNFTSQPGSGRPMLGSGEGVNPVTGAFNDLIAPMGYNGHSTGGFPPFAGPDGGVPVRYLSHTDGNGVRSLGLFGPDGQTTADVNVPWTQGNPSEVQVLETSIGADGQVVRNAVHRLVRNADGTYSGTRIDADGTVITYTTGAEGTGHPLTGIQLLNTAHAQDGGQPTWMPTANYARNGGSEAEGGPALWQGAANRPRVVQSAEPASAGGSGNPPGGGKPPFPPAPGDPPGTPLGDEGPLDLGSLLGVDGTWVTNLRSNRRDEGGIRAEAIELAYRDTLAALGKTELDAGDGAAFAQNVAARFVEFGIDPVNPSRNLPQGIPVVPTSADADLALRYSGLQLGDSWGVLVRDIDPQTQDIRITEVHENELLFFNPATRQTFGRSQNDGTPPLQFEDSARVYHPGTNREYIYNAATQRFEPLTVPADAQLYYNPDYSATFIRHADGVLEFFGLGTYPAAKGQAWAPSKTDAANEAPAGAGWMFNPKTNRTYAPDETGQLRPLNTGDLLAHYNASDGATYVIDPVSGQVVFFGQGDNRNPELAPRPGWVRRGTDWMRHAVGDKRLGIAGRAKLPIPSWLRISGPTEISAGRSLGTKTGAGKPHKSDRWWEFKNAPLAFLLGVSNQEAFQFKASTFVKLIQNVLGGKAEKSPFDVDVVSMEELGPYEGDPAKTVVDLTVTLQLKTDDAVLQPGETDFFGSRSNAREVPNGIPFNKVMSEIKINLPVWARALIAAKYGASFEEFVYALTFRPSAESRPEISISGIPEGARLPEQFLQQVSASLGQSRIRIQVVTSDPAALRSALEQNPNLASHGGLYDAGPSLIYVPRGPSSGMRLSSVTGEHGRLHITDLAGQQREVMNPSQMNLDVIFNKRASLDYWADRYLLWPVKRGLSASPVGQWWGQTRFGRRLQPQPHFTPGHGFYRSIRDANQKAARRATLAITPVNLFGIVTGEIRAASKSAGKPGDVPKVLNDSDLVWLDWTYDDGSKASITVPGWLGELVLTGSTGEGVLWPKGGAEALTPLLDHWQSSFAVRPDRVDPLIAFRKTLLPQFKDGDYLSRAQVTEILNFLEAMA